MTVKGKIKWVNNEREYGFIDCGSGEDIFFTSSVFKNKEPCMLSEGDIIEFELATNKGKYDLQKVVIKTKNTIVKIVKSDIFKAIITAIITAMINKQLENNNQSNININIDFENCDIKIVERESNSAK